MITEKKRKFCCDLLHNYSVTLLFSRAAFFFNEKSLSGNKFSDKLNFVQEVSNTLQCRVFMNYERGRVLNTFNEKVYILIQRQGNLNGLTCSMILFLSKCLHNCIIEIQFSFFRQFEKDLKTVQTHICNPQRNIRYLNSQTFLYHFNLFIIIKLSLILKLFISL